MDYVVVDDILIKKKSEECASTFVSSGVMTLARSSVLILALVLPKFLAFPCLTFALLFGPLLVLLSALAVTVLYAFLLRLFGPFVSSSANRMENVGSPSVPS